MLKMSILIVKTSLQRKGQFRVFKLFVLFQRKIYCKLIDNQFYYNFEIGFGGGAEGLGIGSEGRITIGRIIGGIGSIPPFI